MPTGCRIRLFGCVHVLAPRMMFKPTLNLSHLAVPIQSHSLGRKVDAGWVWRLCSCDELLCVGKQNNQALLARQAWRLIAFPDSLCARVLKARYYPRGNLIDTVFSGNPLSTWTAISYGLDLLKKGLIYRVGNGANIRVWWDSWIPRQSYLKVLTPKRNSRIRRVSELLDHDLNWNEEKVRNAFLLIDANLILKIVPGRRVGGDILVWQLEKSRIFSVCSA
jgi:hypothetical protein